MCAFTRTRDLERKISYILVLRAGIRRLEASRMSEEGLIRKKRVRGGHKASVNRTLKLVEEALAAPEANAAKLRQYLQILRDKMDTVGALDTEILNLVVEDDEITEEIGQADIFRETIQLAAIEIETALAGCEQVNSPTATPARSSRTPVREDDTVEREDPLTEVASSETSNSSRSHDNEQPPQTSSRPVRMRDSKVRLPKLTLEKFNGDITSWTSFWDSFESAIHLNEDLTDIDKFNYLRSLMEHSALEAITGLTLSSANYAEAISILKKRFGDKQQQITKHMEALLELEPVPSPRDLKSLRKLYDKVEAHIRCLKSLGVTASSYGSLLSSILMKKIPAELCLILTRETVKENGDLESMMKALELEIDARERAAVESGSIPRKPAKEYPTVAALFTENTPPSCCYCSGSHQPQQCESVPSVEQRKQSLRQTGRCFVCLKRGHLGKDCRSPLRCSNCNSRHHSSICYAARKANDHPHINSPLTSLDSRGTTTRTGVSAPHTPQTSVHSMHVSGRTPVLLQTARTQASNPLYTALATQVRIILDSGSQRSYVTDRLKRELQLPTEHTENMIVKTFGSGEQKRYNCSVTRIRLHTKDGHGIELELVAVPLICEPLCGQPIVCAVKQLPELSHLDLADTSTCTDNLNVDILIGCDYYWQIVTGNMVRTAEGPTAIETTFGWVLSGPAKNITCLASYNTQLNTSISLRIDSLPEDSKHVDLEQQLKRFWDLDVLGIQEEEPSLYDKFLAGVSYNGQRYEVKLPWKEFHAPLPDNLDLCQQRLSNLLKRLRRDPDILREYDAIIRNQIENNIIEPIEDPFSSATAKVHYLPHHPVIRKDKSTTKVRIVYDASARSNGVSLNDCLYTGPSFGQCILDILLRFRVPKVAFTADIEKAFLMVSMAQEDRDVLRFLWVDSIEKDLPRIVVLRFNRVTFGVSSSPFLLNATIQYHLKRYLHRHQAFVDQFLRSIYVDDLVGGADEPDKAFQLYTMARSILKEGGFNLRKLRSNSATLEGKASGGLENPSVKTTCIAEDDESYVQNTLGDDHPLPGQGQQKVLGVQWDMAEDQLKSDLMFPIHLVKECEPTKRNIISLASRIYDPMGIISPVTVQFKILAQTLCRAKLGWDEELSGELLQKWEELRNRMCAVKPITIPRCYLQRSSRCSTRFNLIGFCDASLQAYAAVIYLLMKGDSESYSCLVASKTRVAPLSKQTIPRLELISALLLSKLISQVSTALKDELPLEPPRCYTDSKVALYWIRGENKEWKQFIQNRVTSIRRLCPQQLWDHCDGSSNPADIPSRGRSLSDETTLTLWLNGPQWLHCGKEPGQQSSDSSSGNMPEECLAELKNSTTAAESSTFLTTNGLGIDPILECENFSSLKRLLRITSQVIKYVDTLKLKLGNTVQRSSDEADNLVRAERYWIKVSQQQFMMMKEFHVWKNQFGLYLDNDGVWRCKGRLGNANIPEAVKHPILLSPKHHFTLLVVQQCHAKVMHGGLKETLTEIRSRYWLVKGRQFIRKVIHQCFVCKRFTSKPYIGPPPPPLPPMRVQEAPPFAHIGVDFAGPLYVKDVDKVWICLYTCCVTRAIHLEVVPNLTAEAFLRFQTICCKERMPHKNTFR